MLLPLVLVVPPPALPTLAAVTAARAPPAILQLPQWRSRLTEWRDVCKAARLLRKAAEAAELARLKAVYSAAEEGKLGCNDTDVGVIRSIGGSNAAGYGELTPKGFSELGARLGLTADDRFVDLGSGTGKLVIQSVTEFGVASACGIELSTGRHERALLGQSGQSSETVRRSSFVNGDCSGEAAAAVLEDASVVWLCATLFNDDLMQRIGLRLSGSSAVRAVATTRRFPGGLVGYALEKDRAVLHEMSWTAAQVWPGGDRVLSGNPDIQAGVAVYVYLRT